MHKRGFTLVEIIIATVILATVTAGLAYVFLAGRRHIMHIRSKIQAAELGRFFLGRLQMDVREDRWGTNCLSSDPTTGCETASIGIDNITYTPIYKVSNIGSSLRKVKLTINWDEPAF